MKDTEWEIKKTKFRNKETGEVTTKPISILELDKYEKVEDGDEECCHDFIVCINTNKPYNELICSKCKKVKKVMDNG